MEWIDSVNSLRYHMKKVAARSTPKITVLASSGSPTLVVMLSVTKVPNTLTRVTANQYLLGMYRLVRNWRTKATTSRMPVITEVPVRPRFRLTLRKSAAVSPTVVQSTLMIQK